MNPLEMFGAMIFAHALADYPLQGDFLSKAKNRTAPIPGVPWQQAMFAHSVIHGGFVALITGFWWLGMLEAAFHWEIDDGKCRGYYGFNADQAFHVACKATWAALVWLVYQ